MTLAFIFIVCCVAIAAFWVSIRTRSLPRNEEPHHEDLTRRKDQPTEVRTPREGEPEWMPPGRDPEV